LHHTAPRPGLAENTGRERYGEASVRWVYGSTMTQALVIVLKRAGNDLSRENIMKAATS
jgi:hypothetical protein